MANRSSKGESLAEYSVILAMTVTVIAAGLNPLSQALNAALQGSGQVIMHQLAPRQEPGPTLQIQRAPLPDIDALTSRTGDEHIRVAVSDVDSGGDLRLHGNGHESD